jgi:hypothetical protein
MAHDHQHHDGDTYYLDQLCLIGLSAAFGGICLGMYFWDTDMLTRLLADQFHPLILLSGIALMVLVVVRSVVLWRATGEQAAHAHHHHDHDHHHHHHEHEHGHDCAQDHPHDCGHDHHGHAHRPTDEAITAQPDRTSAPAGLAGHRHDHHDHHGHTHGHSHGHGHDHDHAWAPWRYVVLLVPVMLFLLGVPRESPGVGGTAEVDFRREASVAVGVVALGPLPLLQAASAAVALDDPLARGTPIVVNGKPASFADLEPQMPVAIEEAPDQRLARKRAIREIRAGADVAGKAASDLLTVGVIKEVKPKEQLLTVTLPDGKDRQFDLIADGLVYGIDFKALEALGFSPSRREEFNGKVVQVVGQYAPQHPNLFQLARYRRQCCAADAVQVSVPIMTQEAVTHLKRNDWVRVIGRIEFRQQPGFSGLKTVLRVARAEHVKETQPEVNPYID